MVIEEEPCTGYTTWLGFLWNISKGLEGVYFEAPK